VANAAAQDSFCSGTTCVIGPWVMTDLDDGLFSGVNQHYNANDPTVNYRHLTAIVKGQPNQWASGPATPGRAACRPSTAACGWPLS
jgi:hypothetical protein